MTHQGKNAALLNQLRKNAEEMFHGATIQELSDLVDEVFRTRETNVRHSRRGDLNVLDPSHFAGRKSGR
jgi:hypothetical protein